MRYLQMQGDIHRQPDVYVGSASPNSTSLENGLFEGAGYRGETQTNSEVIFKQLDVPNVAGRDLLILDDILESGHTLAAVRKKLERAKPRSIQVCVLRSKSKQRAREVDAAYIGFEIDDDFVVRLRARLHGAISQPAVRWRA